MNKFFIFLACTFVFSVSTGHATSKIEAIIPAFESYIQQSMQDWKAPAVAVAIVKDGKVVYQKAFGVKEAGKAEPVDDHTVFQIASLTKTFLVTLIGQLVDEKKLCWDDPVIKYLPNFFIADQKTTEDFKIRDLISHRSGLPPFSGDTLWDLGCGQDEIKHALAKIPLQNPVRLEYGYQNHLFGVAGLVVEKVMGKPISELFQDRIFSPIGMTDSSDNLQSIQDFPKNKGIFGWFKSLFKKTPPVEDKKNVALPHHIIDGQVHSLQPGSWMYIFPGSTGVNTSISDLAKWMIFHLNNGKVGDKQIISLPSQKEMRSPQVLANHLRPDDMQFPATRIRNVSYGMGWFLYEYGTDVRKVQAIGHMGGYAGVRSLMTLVPGENVGIVILSNFGALRVSMLPEALRNKFLDLYMDLPDNDWSRDNLEKMQTIRDKNKRARQMQKLNALRIPQPLDVYVGDYENELYGSLKVTEKDGKLALIYRDKVIPLTHWNNDEFSFNSNQLSLAYCDYDTGYIEFGVREKKAIVCAINLLHEGKEDIFHRIK
ncbi:MAG: serine hydrolase [Alphaproteobacteria bacterium]|nr:serine hydrolase [Alphaproteobacteria bacterium]